MTTSTSKTLKEAIRAEALALDFDQVGFAPPDLARAGPSLKAFLDKGRHGTMDWLEARADQRADPKTLWPEARSVIVVAHNYGPDHDPLEDLKRADRGVVSVYARGKDYHDVLKKRLKRLARWVAETQGGEVKVFVDTAPVMEKPLAEVAGLGWQGKHTNLVSAELGSWFFLGVIYTTLVFEPDARHEDRCGSCRACLDICPTDAFPAPYELDARRCISYLTIEHKGHIPVEFRRPMGNRIYGCDDCLAICPWNKFAQTARETAYHARLELKAPLLGDLVGLDDKAFREVFSGSPIKRTGRDRFVRNVLIAIANTGDPGFAPRMMPLLADRAAVVRAMAVWALHNILEADEFAALRRLHASAEEDPDVLVEWNRA
jgi:epoxyqueuosine reductase